MIKKPHWQRFGQFLNYFLNDFVNDVPRLCENSNLRYANLEFFP